MSQALEHHGIRNSTMRYSTFHKQKSMTYRVLLLRRTVELEAHALSLSSLGENEIPFPHYVI